MGYPLGRLQDSAFYRMDSRWRQTRGACKTIAVREIPPLGALRAVGALTDETEAPENLLVIIHTIKNMNDDDYTMQPRNPL